MTETEVAEEAPAATDANPAAAGVTDLLGCDISDVGEIFHYPRKLQVEEHTGFDPRAITELDEILYATLKARDRPETRDIAIPDRRAFWEAIEPMPVFLQRAAE